MRIAVALGVTSAAGFLALAPVAPGPEPAPRGAYRHEPVGIAPGHLPHEAPRPEGGGRGFAPPLVDDFGEYLY
jgi:hypothetical protein